MSQSGDTLGMEGTRLLRQVSSPPIGPPMCPTATACGVQGGCAPFERQRKKHQQLLLNQPSTEKVGVIELYSRNIDNRCMCNYLCIHTYN